MPVEKTFSGDGMTFTSEIKPATLRDAKTKKFRSFFPYFRELRLEYALISIASKQWLAVDYAISGEASYRLQVTYYQIQKEIVEAINRQEGKNLKPNDCPYNTSSIKEDEIITKANQQHVFANNLSEYI